MVDRVAPEGAAPPSRLERWLTRKLREGRFRGLPGYQPLSGPGPEHPEHYARSLLDALRRVGLDRAQLERLRDDGRAFRSWVESVCPAPARAVSTL